MKILVPALAFSLCAAATAAPALADTAAVQDGAGMFSAATVTSLNQRLASFNAQTRKQVVVVTVPALPAGQSVSSAAEQTFAQQRVDGTLIYVARDDRKIYVLPDRAASGAGWITPETATSISQSIGAAFKTENYDAGITAGVDSVLNIYRSHLSSLPGANAPAGRAAGNGGGGSSGGVGGNAGGFHLPMFLWIVIIVFGFLIVRSVLRAMSGPRYYGGAPGGVPPPGPGYPPPGYASGPGYYGGGGGGFWSGLLGGLGGAWLGNEMFRGGGMGGGLGGGALGSGDQAAGMPADPGWSSDAGQPGSGGGADWGGGGFGDSGGGDSGGGFGGDSGGGGGDGGGGSGW